MRRSSMIFAGIGLASGVHGMERHFSSESALSASGERARHGLGRLRKRPEEAVEPEADERARHGLGRLRKRAEEAVEPEALSQLQQGTASPSTAVSAAGCCEQKLVAQKRKGRAGEVGGDSDEIEIKQHTAGAGKRETDEEQEARREAAAAVAAHHTASEPSADSAGPVSTPAPPAHHQAQEAAAADHAASEPSADSAGPVLPGVAPAQQAQEASAAASLGRTAARDAFAQLVPAGPGQQATARRTGLPWTVEEADVFPAAAVADLDEARRLRASASSFSLRENELPPQAKCVEVKTGNAVLDKKWLVPCLMPEIGNGYFATVSPLCHKSQQGCGALFVAGVYEGGAEGVSKRSALPNPFFGVQPRGPVAPTFSAGGAPEHSVLLDARHHQLLDVRGGSLLFVWTGLGPNSANSVQFRFYAHRARKHLLVLEISTDSPEAFDLPLHQAPPAVSATARGPADADGGTARAQSPTADLGTFLPKIPAPDSNIKYRLSKTREKESEDLQKALLTVVEAHSDGTVDRSDRRFSKLPDTVFSLSKDNPQVFLVAFASNTNEGLLLSDAELVDIAKTRLQEAMGLSPAALYQEHAAAWAKLWEGGVEIHDEALLGESGEREKGGEKVAKSGEKNRDEEVDAVREGVSPDISPTLVEKTTMFSLYYLLSSFREDVSWSSSPGGLATNGYNGHVFWDTELWMLPGMLLFHPEIVKTGMLQYRVKTIQGARRRSFSDAKKGSACDPPGEAYQQLPDWLRKSTDAGNVAHANLVEALNPKRKNGSSYTPPRRCRTKGARFAWESALTGMEAGPDGWFTVTNEIHNTAGVAFAADMYMKANRGTEAAKQFLYKRNTGGGEPVTGGESAATGYEALLQDTADFWADYVSWEAAPPSAEAATKPEASSQVARLLQVNPPDENAGIVDDPVSPNALAQRNLAASRTWHPRSTDDGERAAPRFWVWGDSSPGDSEKHLSAAEQAALSRWGQTTDGLRAARDAFLYDEALDAHLEFARKYVAVNSSTLGTESFDLETSPVMQADTVLLGFPLDMGEEFFPLGNTRRNDLLNAEHAYIDSAPCMTWSVQTSGWLSLKMLHKAKQGLHKAFANAEGDFRIWTEFPGGGTTHFLTGMGGFLQTMTYGMAGLRLYDYGMLISPNLLPSGPAGYAKETSRTRSYVLRGVWFLGCQLRIEWGETEKENKKMQMLYRITVMKCEDGAQSPEHHSGPPPKKSFPIVARWLKVAEEEDMGFEFGDGVNRHGPATVIEMERAFEEDSLQLDFHPDFGAYRHYDKSGFPPLLLQHKQDQPKWPERPPALDEYKHCDRSDIPFKKGKQTGFRGFKIVPGIVTNQGYGDEVAVEMAKVKISVSSEPQEDRRMSETKSSGGDDGAEKCREWCNEGAEECDRWIWNQNEKTCLLQVDGAEKCREACEEAAECDRWMWNKDEETCYFYLYKPAHASSPQPSGRMEEPWRFRLPPYLLQDDCCVLGSRCDTDPRLDVSERWWERERQGGQVSGTSGAPTATAAALKTGADGLVLTKTEADGMKAKAAAELKAWQDDEAARNAKTEKRLSKWDLKDINRLFTSSQTPLAAPHDSKKYTGGTPAVDPGGSGKAFGGITMQDGPQGFRGAVEKGKTVYGEGKAATMLPAAAAIGMSWDPEFAYVYARVMAREFRMNRANMILGPTVTTWRVPLSGRNFESLAGEDPAIAATLLPAYKQATNEMGVSTSLKHYMMNDWEKDRKTNRVSTPLTAVFELQLKAFAAGIAMGGSSVMCSYTWLCVPDEMGVVKKQNCLGSCLNKDSLGWILPLSDRFFVVSDWAATGGSPKNENNYSHDDDPAFYMHAGLSSEQPDNTVDWAGKRVFQPESGRGLDAVDAGLRRKMAQRIVAAMEDVEKSGGDLLKDKTMSQADYKSEIDTKHRKIGHRLVAESVVLLKNEDHALPLLLRPGDGEKGVQITTYGCATTPRGNLDCSCSLGGRDCSWCKKNGIVWDDPENVFYGGSGSGSVDPNKGENEIQTIAAALDAAAEEVSDIGVEVLGHKDLQSTLTLGPKGGAASGGKREVALVCASTGSGESADRGGLKLNKLEKLIKSQQKGAAFQVVLFMSTPGYIDLPVADIVDPADAILLSVFPGQYVGAGLMQLLFNKTPPSAKLTFTIGNYEGKTYEPNTNSEGNAVIDYTKTDGPDGMQTGYRWYQAHGARPLFPFGHGLTSLADWGKDFKVSVSRHDATLRRISFCVDFFMPAGADAWTKLNAKAGGGRNEVKASPVVQFYVKKQKPVTRNYLELLTFAKLREMKPGEKRCGAVFYTEPVATYSPAKRKYIPSTEFQLWVGLNGYGAESGATQVPATTKAAQPELPEYTLQDYRSFVIETVKKEEIEAAARPNLAKHLSYLTNGDQAYKNWAL